MAFSLCCYFSSGIEEVAVVIMKINPLLFVTAIRDEV